MIFKGKSHRKDDFHVNEYSDMHKFARRWQYEFASLLDCDVDEAYDEACEYWRKNSAYGK